LLAGSSNSMVGFDSPFFPSVLSAFAVAAPAEVFWLKPGAAVGCATVFANVAVVAGVGIDVSVSIEMVVPTFLLEGGVEVEDAVEEEDSMDSDLAAATICSPASLS
jgi:hypothetical protein